MGEKSMIADSGSTGAGTDDLIELPPRVQVHDDGAFDGDDGGLQRTDTSDVHAVSDWASPIPVVGNAYTRRWRCGRPLHLWSRWRREWRDLVMPVTLTCVRQ